MKSTKVSIVIPTYNQCEYLKETIESVLSQTYQHVELIVVNDGSTDNTERVLNEYKDIITVVHQKNSGQSVALNKGWTEAKGELIGYISSDDRLKPDCIMRIVDTWCDDPGVVALYPDYHLIDSNGHEIRRVYAEDYSAAKLRRDLVCIPGPGAFFLKSGFIELGGWNTSFSQVPDFDFWVRLSFNGRFRRVPESLAEFRIHGSSSSVKKVSTERSDEIIKVAELVEAEWRKEALCNAFIFSARSHFQSLRFLSGFQRALTSVRVRPGIILKRTFYWSILSGCFRRFIY